MAPALTLLVVCEGSSDYALLDGVAQAVGRSLGREVELRLQEPSLDATTMRHEAFGWTQVRAWCRKHAKRPKMIDQMLLLGRADCLLIHIDADIAEKIGNDLPSSPDQGENSRRQQCHAALDAWLGVAASNAQIFYVIPTFQIETWILATYGQESNPELFAEDVEDYETMADVEGRLLKIGYQEDRERPGRMYKEETLYRSDKYLPRLLGHLDLATRRCRELHLFRDKVAALSAG